MECVFFSSDTGEKSFMFVCIEGQEESIPVLPQTEFK